MSFMQQLKAGTTSVHQALEEQRFAQRLASGRVVREEYLSYLRALETIHQELERVPLPQPVDSLWDSDMARSTQIAADLCDLDAPSVDSLSPALACAIAAAQQLRSDRVSQAASLIGSLYVLEGSTLGGAQISRRMGQALNGVGVSYLQSYGERRGEHWKSFSSRVNALPLSLVEPALMGARAMFQTMSDLFYRLDMSEPLSANAVNADAGTHPITSDRLELESALLAAEASMRQFPYLEARYGARGRRFATSDSAWLVALNQHSQGQVLREVRWLGVVLSSRGMPRLLLEEHLSLLVSQLESDLKGDYGRLHRAAEALKEERLSALPGDVTRTLEQQFLSEAPPAELEKHPDLASLILGAIADEANGIKFAVKSLLVWVTDDKWSSGWLRAVEQLVREARASVVDA